MRGRDIQSRSRGRGQNDLSKLSDSSFLRKSPSNFIIENQIQEVEENFEASGNNFGPQGSLRGPYDPPDSIDDWNGGLTGSLPQLDTGVYKKNMTPQRLPAIKAPLLRGNVGIDYMSMDHNASTNRLNGRRVSEPQHLNKMYQNNLPSAKSQYNHKLNNYSQ